MLLADPRPGTRCPPAPVLTIHRPRGPLSDVHGLRGEAGGGHGPQDDCGVGCVSWGPCSSTGKVVP